MLLPALPALEAHDLGSSESRLDVDAHTVRAALFINPLEFKYVDQDRSGAVSKAEVDEAIPAIFGATKAVFGVRGVTEASSVTLDRYQLLADGTLRMDLTYSYPETVRELTLTSHLDQLGRADHKHATAIYMNGTRHDAVLDAQRPTTRIRPGFNWGGVAGMTVVLLVIVTLGIAARAIVRRSRR